MELIKNVEAWRQIQFGLKIYGVIYGSSSLDMRGSVLQPQDISHGCDADLAVTNLALLTSEPL